MHAERPEGQMREQMVEKVYAAKVRVTPQQAKRAENVGYELPNDGGASEKGRNVGCELQRDALACEKW